MKYRDYNETSVQVLKDSIPLLRHKLSELEDYLENGLIYDDVEIKERLQKIQNLVTGMKSANRDLIIHIGD
jgi:hypothetical protein